ncbi:ARID DNA-binding domain-containing protein [Tanacetum coccineum]|uniref:ARID DNA-binding domain-containing protein n=1 Tax=Tanacetum coccineum TaxID=301880 RepID=A0ABQ5HHU2_9ASTR
MPSPNSHSSKWPKVHRSTYGLPNIWYQSKDWGPMRREQKLEFVQRQLKRENQEQIGSCMKKISEDCKDMLKDKMKEVMQFNSSLNNPISNNRYKHYRCFQCKELGHIVKYCPMDKKKIGKRRMEGIEASKPSVMITYPETIHFSTSTMIKDTDLTTWDEIWYVSDKLDRHVCYKLDAFCNIKENFCVTNLENQKKFLFSYGIGEVLIEQGSNKLIIPGVHYTPEVTLNILSLELLEKQGFDVGYDGNRCTLFPMFKDKKIHHFDEDKMRKMQNKYLQDYFESIANKDGMEQDTVRIKGNRNLYSTKVQTFNDFVIFLNLIKHDDIVSQEWDYFRNRFNKLVKWFFNHYLERSLPGSLPPIVNGVEIHLFDLYKLIENLGGYLSVHFSQEFDKVGEIMGLPKGNGEEIRRCYMNYLEILTSHLKTARAPLKAHTCAPLEPAWKAEIDREGLGTHQWKTGEHGANLTRSAVPKGKEVLEHFGVQLEDTTKYPSEPTQVHYMEKQQKFHTVPSSSKVKEEYASSTSSGDFTVIT